MRPSIELANVLASGAFVRAFVTDRRSCARPLADHVALLKGCVDLVILREKDLGAKEYEALAQDVSAACARAGMAFAAHTQVDVARRMGCSAVHLPLPLLREQGRPAGFSCVGTNVHAAAEVSEAEALGADLLIASPVFAPSCKPGAPFGGASFLRDVVERARIPVLALGGITDESEQVVRACGAAGACRMADYARR
ncbi:thiamine phosphate synthase [Paraeggerthella hongkongensis]|jgi:thiamine-phosphate diphosphorylase|uniref:thiamine phosphate synthase n=2 Tax=Paraeggerthella sp. TaxID=2897350 RepID=UPI000DF792BA|nr:thiamine phosphate synthase [Paraeggerthella hongkongensis]